MADSADDIGFLRVRRLRALTLYDATAKDLALSPNQEANGVSAEERALVNVGHLLDWPPHAMPWWLSHAAHATCLRHLRAPRSDQARQMQP